MKDLILLAALFQSVPPNFGGLNLTVQVTTADSATPRAPNPKGSKHGYATVTTEGEGMRVHGFEYSSPACQNLLENDRVVGKWIVQNKEMAVVVPRFSGGVEACLLTVKMGPGEGYYIVGKDGKATFQPTHHQ